MKKFFAVMIALMMVLTASFACAEARDYVMVGVQDADGNVVSIEDLGEEMPIVVFGMDDEAMTCYLGTEEAVMEGTIEIAEQTDEYIALNATLADGSSCVVYWVKADDAVSFATAEGVVAVLMNVEALEAAAE